MVVRIETSFQDPDSGVLADDTCDVREESCFVNEEWDIIELMMSLIEFENSDGY
jgi:hypothetical protein